MTRSSSRPAPSGPPIRLRPGAAAGRLPDDQFSRRSLGLLLVYVLLALLAVGRLVQVQVVRSDDYAAAGADQRDQFVTLSADRGRLYDRNGEVLAASVAAVSVYADPRAFVADGTAGAPDVDDTAAALAPLLGVPVGDVADRLRQPGAFAYLARQVDRDLGARIDALDLDGIGTLPEPRRVYPGGTLAAQLLGLTDIDGTGIAGLELEHQGLLAGQPGWMTFERTGETVSGEIPTGERELQTAVAGTDLVLTIDRQIQYTAERVAAEVAARHRAVGASIVVLEVGTGDVLAMASAPLADLTDRSSLQDAALRNRAVTDVLEPGSVQKAITAAAALEEGIVTPHTEMWVQDAIEVSDGVFRDSHSHPPELLTFSQIIETSSNVGTIMVAQELGEQRLASWLERFGYGQPVGVDFPGESGGLLRPVTGWSGTSLPTIAIGQGVAVTLLQAANAYATIANDGVAVTPRLLRGTVGEDGRLQPSDVREEERVVSVETATQLRQILATVIDGENGTGGAAAVEGHTVAGKTGTAQKPNPAGGYVAGGHIATFVGMAPADAPQLVVAVMVDEPDTIWGGVVAAPAFSEVMTEGLRRVQVAPSIAVDGPGATALSPVPMPSPRPAGR